MGDLLLGDHKKLCGLEYTQINVNYKSARRSRRHVQKLPPSADLTSCNSLDHKLYQYALSRLDKQLEQYPACKYARLDGKRQVFRAPDCEEDTDDDDDDGCGRKLR